MYLGMTECHILFSGHCDLDLRPSFKNYCGQSLSPIFFEVGIPNLVCEYILGWRSVAYHFGVTVTLTFDLGFRIIVPRAYLLYSLRKKSQIWYVNSSCDDEVLRTIIVSL